MSNSKRGFTQRFKEIKLYQSSKEHDIKVAVAIGYGNMGSCPHFFFPARRSMMQTTGRFLYH